MSVASSIRGRALALALVTVPALASCGGDDPTEIVLVIDSDLEVPTELDAIEVTVSGRRGAPTIVSADLTDSATPDLPLTLTLYPSSVPPSPVAIAIVASAGGTDVVRRDVRTGFVEGETRMLRVLLAARCVSLSCDGGRTCDETGCRPIEIAASDLPEWPGQAPILDGPACTPTDEILQPGRRRLRRHAGRRDRRLDRLGQLR